MVMTMGLVPLPKGLHSLPGPALLKPIMLRMGLSSLGGLRVRIKFSSFIFQSFTARTLSIIHSDEWCDQSELLRALDFFGLFLFYHTSPNLSTVFLLIFIRPLIFTIISP